MEVAELMPKLEDVVESYREVYPSFPFRFCQDVSLKLHRDFGFLWVKGKYSGRFDPEYLERARKKWNLPNDVFEVSHDFSYDPVSRLFIDLTAKQFDRSQPDILILERADPRVAVDWDQRTNQTTHYVTGMYDLTNHGSNPIDLLPNGETRMRRLL